MKRDILSIMCCCDVRFQFALYHTAPRYVGVQMIKALLAMNSYGHPLQILCLCYTNHALDSFLLGLIESGAVEDTDIVRVGGSKKVCGIASER